MYKRTSPLCLSGVNSETTHSTDFHKICVNRFNKIRGRVSQATPFFKVHPLQSKGVKSEEIFVGQIFL